MFAWRSLALVIALHGIACHKREHEEATKKEGAHAGDTTSISPAEDAILAYESAGSCDVRAQTITFPKENRALLLGKAPCTSHKVEYFDPRTCNNLLPNLTHCIASARRDGASTRYFLVRQPSGAFLVDFRATEHIGSLADFVAQRPTTPTIVRARGGTTGAYYGPFRHKETSYVCIGLTAFPDERDARVYAYAPRGSDDAAKLASTYTDARHESVTIVLASASQDYPVTAVITKILATDLFETDAEHAFEAAARDGGS
jgi:hypothetical protein